MDDDFLEELDEIDEVLEEPPPEEIPDKNLDQIVDEVAEGKWGRGQMMRLNLAKAGYDHVAVQKALVERMNGR